MDAATRPASYWEGVTKFVTEPGRHVMFLVWEGDAILGSPYGLIDRERSQSGRVGSMWVNPV